MEARGIHFLDEDSDDIGFEVRVHSKTVFWWAWSVTEVLEVERQVLAEQEHWHEEALRQDREEAEHLRYLIAACGLDGEGSQGA